MIGIDLIKTSRMNHLMQRFGDKALKKFLSQDEIKLVKNFMRDLTPRKELINIQLLIGNRL